MVFRPIDLYVITSTFFCVFYVFSKSKNVTFYVFLPCFIRFLELWLLALDREAGIVAVPICQFAPGKFGAYDRHDAK